MWLINFQNFSQCLLFDGFLLSDSVNFPAALIGRDSLLILLQTRMTHSENWFIEVERPKIGNSLHIFK